jgi:hypothetical protein
MAQKVSLAGGFALIGTMYILAFISAAWPMEIPGPVAEAAD